MNRVLQKVGSGCGEGEPAGWGWSWSLKAAHEGDAALMLSWIWEEESVHAGDVFPECWWGHMVRRALREESMA